jgi:hypothetical protein
VEDGEDADAGAEVLGSDQKSDLDGGYAERTFRLAGAVANHNRAAITLL